MKHRLAHLAILAVVALAAVQLYAQTEPATAPPATAPQTQAATAAAPAPGMVIPAGTQLQIRTNEAINATKDDVGRTFSAEIADNILDANGNMLAPKGSPAQLTVAKVGTTAAGVGSNEVSLALQSINVGGRTYTVQSNTVQQQSNRGIGANKRTAEMTGGGALLGTLIGAAAGGGKGAAIGAIVGGVGGATAQVLTKGNEVKVPAESLLTFKLDQPLQLQ